MVYSAQITSPLTHFKARRARAFLRPTKKYDRRLLTNSITADNFYLNDGHILFGWQYGNDHWQLAWITGIACTS